MRHYHLKCFWGVFESVWLVADSCANYCMKVSLAIQCSPGFICTLFQSQNLLLQTIQTIIGKSYIGYQWFWDIFQLCMTMNWIVVSSLILNSKCKVQYAASFCCRCVYFLSEGLQVFVNLRNHFPLHQSFHAGPPESWCAGAFSSRAYLSARGN